METFRIYRESGVTHGGGHWPLSALSLSLTSSSDEWNFCDTLVRAGLMGAIRNVKTQPCSRQFLSL